MPKNDVASKLAVKIFSPFETFYDGEALTVTAANEVGPFDVLYNHANFFSLLVACDVVVNSGFQLFQFSVNHGIIKVRENQVTVFVDV